MVWNTYSYSWLLYMQSTLMEVFEVGWFITASSILPWRIWFCTFLSVSTLRSKIFVLLHYCPFLSSCYLFFPLQPTQFNFLYLQFVFLSISPLLFYKPWTLCLVDMKDVGLLISGFGLVNLCWHKLCVWTALFNQRFTPFMVVNSLWWFFFVCHMFYLKSLNVLFYFISLKAVCLHEFPGGSFKWSLEGFWFDK